MGTFTGKTIMEGGEGTNPALRLSDLRSTGCSHMPLDEAKQYTVISFGMPAYAADAMGLCSVANPDAKQDLASICVAFSCVGGCTVASQLSGAALGCFVGNPDVDASTEGLSEIAGEAIELGLGSTGFGLSLTGDFAKPQTLWIIPERHGGSLHAMLRRHCD